MTEIDWYPSALDVDGNLPATETPPYTLDEYPSTSDYTISGLSDRGDRRRGSHSLSSGNDELGRLLWIYFAPFIFFVGVVGNTLILLVMSQRRMRGTTTCVYLRWMAAADLVALVTGMITEWIEHYTSKKIVFKEINPVTCKLEKLLVYSGADTSIWICVLFTIDRFFAIVYPIERRRLTVCSPKNSVYWSVLVTLGAIGKNLHVIWTRGPEYRPHVVRPAETMMNGTSSRDAFDATLTSTVPLTVSKLHKICGRPTFEYEYFEQFVRPWLAFSLMTALPFLIIVCCNAVIITSLIQLRRSRRTSMIAASPDSNVFQMTTLCLSASICFLVCVTPTMILLIVKPFYGEESPTVGYTIAKSITNQLFYVNHSINFFLYCITGQRFRRAMMDLCRCNRSDRTSRLSTEAFPAAGFFAGPHINAYHKAGGPVYWRPAAPNSAPTVRRKSTPENGVYSRNDCRATDAKLQLLWTPPSQNSRHSSASFQSACYLVNVDSGSDKRLSGAMQASPALKRAPEKAGNKLLVQQYGSNAALWMARRKSDPTGWYSDRRESAV